MPTVNPQLREALDFFATTYGLRNLEAAVAEMAEGSDRPETPAAIRGHLLAQLEGWPDTFRRRLEPWIRSLDSEPRGSLKHAERVLRRFEALRNPPPPPQSSECDAAACVCGCRGANSGLALSLRKIRYEAARLRQAKRPKERVWHREWLDEAKTDFLVWMWASNQRKVDRLGLGQHAVDAAKHELEHLAAEPAAVRGWADSLRARLAAGVYMKGRKKGQPYTERTREPLERELAGFEARYHAAVDRIRALRAMLPENVPALVRDFSGCARLPAGSVAEREYLGLRALGLF